MKQWYLKLLCKIYGCDWRFNFRSIPNRCICYRCHNKAELNLRTLEWEPVPHFSKSLGTDEEIKLRWIK